MIKLSIFKKFKPYMGNKMLFIPLAIIISGVSAIFNVCTFYYVWRVCKELLNESFLTNNIKHYVLMVFILSILSIVFYFISLIVSHLAAFQIEIGIKKAGFEKAMSMPLGFYNIHSSGEIRKIVNDGAAGTHLFLAHQLPDIAGAVITPIMVLFMFFYFDWRLGISVLIPIFLSFILLANMMNDKGKILRKKYMDAMEDMSSEAVEYVRIIPVVKTFGQSIKSFNKFYNSIEKYRTIVVAWTKSCSVKNSLYTVLLNSTALFLIPTSMLIINNTNISDVISNFVLYLILAPQLYLIMMRSMRFNQEKFVADEAIDRYNNLFNYNELVYPEESVSFEKQTIEFKNVKFSYDSKINVLENINFKVNRGETLALVGASGSGKTTIARLAARFWDVDSGEILIGDKNIKSYSKEVLMNNISFIFQNTELFKATIKENICFGNYDISKEMIDQAINKSRSKEIIDKLNDGLETVIGTKGTYLSGGEKQRISLARAFIKDAPIVLLDEATAFADPENEHLIQAALKELSKHKTTIIIAHRMTTVKDADKIVVLDKGKIVECGNHTELMSKKGIYKKMWDEYQSTIIWNIKRGA